MRRILLCGNSQYTKRLRRGNIFSLEVFSLRPGYIGFYASGKNARKVFKHEPGGHRVQRCPPNEKRGRIHTSTITVSVLEDINHAGITIKESELRWKFCRGSGKGGQHRNVTDSAVHLTHIPSGISVRVENERSQRRNKEIALSIIKAKINESNVEKLNKSIKAKKKKQVGSGQRGDKIRTVRMQDGQVTDHRLGIKMRLKSYERGDFSKLLKH